MIHHNNQMLRPQPRFERMADALFLVLLILHIGAIVAWMGGAALFVSVIIPSLSKMSPASRGEFIQSALPRYLRFITGSSILAILAGLILYGYTTQTATSLAPSASGLIYIQAGAVLGLIVLIIALGILVPAGRKFIALTKQPSKPQAQSSAQDPMVAQIAGLQKRMGMAGRLGVALLGIALILMVIGASI
jgi:uncharacterized membrane protein